LPAVWRRHELLAAATHAAIGKWAEGQVLSCNVIETAHRAPSVTPVLVQGADAAAISTYAQSICGVALGSAIGDLSGRAFRIAHMGHVNAPMVLGTLSAIEMAMKALDIPHGEGGVAAAVTSLAKGAGLPGDKRVAETTLALATAPA
ncbi:MAG: hypothetical protein K2X45_13885, partial [Phreatobacter sp.]|nr:hypothetical protein [Phreatobacter sp.]